MCLALPGWWSLCCWGLFPPGGLCCRLQTKGERQGHWEDCSGSPGEALGERFTESVVHPFIPSAPLLSTSSVPGSVGPADTAGPWDYRGLQMGPCVKVLFYSLIGTHVSTCVGSRVKTSRRGVDPSDLGHSHPAATLEAMVTLVGASSKHIPGTCSSKDVHSDLLLVTNILLMNFHHNGSCKVLSFVKQSFLGVY